ncbi:MAG TPA: PTS sugar transporter subunit IIA [Candidatus Coatesbacteria bacterium]|nr:PTS sugar transporter subunit IIA [Candidatus Coatesbacteria bacterium]
MVSPAQNRLNRTTHPTLPRHQVGWSTKGEPLLLEQLIPPGAINLDLSATKTHEALHELAHMVVGQPGLPSNAEVISAIFNREMEYEAAVGSGAAIPHIMMAGPDKPILAVGRSKKGIVFGRNGKEKVKLLFLLISPADDPRQHLFTISRIAKLLHQPEVRESLLKVEEERELRTILKHHDEKVR